MNASLEAVPVSARAQLAPVPAPVPDAGVREGILDVPGEVSLYHGGRLSGMRIAWRLAGPATAPVVCALGGISASRRVFSTEGSKQGWWSEVVGPDRALDANRFRVLSFDYLGGSADTTGPTGESAGAHPSRPFPNISTYDQAELLVRLLNNLGLKSLRAIVGGSYGGMVALAFGERYPEWVGHLIVIGAADRTHPMATAWRSVQRRIVRFAVECGRGKDGLQLARALAMSTYRSSEEFAARFDGAPARNGERFEFPVEQYLFARGSDFADRHKPEAVLCLSESIDLHEVDATRIFVPTTIVGIREDQLVPLADLRGLAARLPVAKLHEISSIYGHDGFLKESDQLRGIFTAALGSAA
ncbi:MAG: Homoserine O-succinyltransferase [Gammaproteobacteria bacterium]|nr:Homoserine O-succinyltransferase [Gammaproteobacteria bacterium]